MVVPLGWCVLVNSVGLQLLQLDNGDTVTVVPLCWCVNSAGLQLLQMDNRCYCKCNGCSVGWCVSVNNVALLLLRQDNGCYCYDCSVGWCVLVNSDRYFTVAAAEIMDDIVVVVPLGWCVNSVVLQWLQQDNRWSCNGCSSKLMCTGQQYWLIDEAVMVVPLGWCVLDNSIGLQLLQLDNKWYCNGCSVRLMSTDQQCWFTVAAAG